MHRSLNQRWTRIQHQAEFCWQNIIVPEEVKKVIQFQRRHIPSTSARARQISDFNSRACLRQWPGQTPLCILLFTFRFIWVHTNSRLGNSEQLLPCSSFITCWSISVLPIWQDCQFILNLILKSRCTASKPPGLSHMEMPSGLLLLQPDPVTQLFPSGSTECQDKVKLVIEGEGNSDLLFTVSWLRGWIGNRCLFSRTI